MLTRIRKNRTGRSRGAGRMAIGVFVVAGSSFFLASAQAHDRADLSQGRFDRDDGFKCSSRVQPRAIARNHFVLDRVTLCRPVFERLPSDRSAVTPPMTPTASTSSLTPNAAALPVWSSNRDHFGNP